MVQLLHISQPHLQFSIQDDLLDLMFVSDIKAEDVVIKVRNKNTKNIWVESDIEVFRSSDSFIFNTITLGDICAFYKEDLQVKLL